jgi:hypothetical protein
MLGLFAHDTINKDQVINHYSGELIDQIEMN